MRRNDASLVYLLTTVIITSCYVMRYTYVRRHKSVMRRHKDVNNQALTSISVNKVTPHNSSEIASHATALPSASNIAEASSSNDACTSRIVNRREPAAVTSRVNRKDVDITLNLFYVICTFYVCVLPYTGSLSRSTPHCSRSTRAFS